MAPSTHRAYQQGVSAFEEFCDQFGLSKSLPVDENIIQNFVAYLSLQGKSFSTVRTYLAGLSSKHKLNGFSDPTGSFLVKKVMKGLSRDKKTKDSRFPITFQKLQELVNTLPLVCSDTYESTLFVAAFSLAFFGLLRISELLGQDSSFINGRPGIQVSDIQRLSNRLQINIVGSKTDQERIGEVICLEQVVSHPDLCPVLSTKQLLEKIPSHSGSLLIHNDGSKLTRYQFQAVLKKSVKFLGWNCKGFTSHSFRIGAATTAAMNGVSKEVLMKMGRWKSDAVKSYIRPI